ncbi:hypothetical protein EPUS_02227 [Endocarpon pusillum Z07020]|uniref:5-formyltetrahydrofolate cyclo-ligase n=1 Tax=Endocarpon pusillum (strain Z07020 / HMAS-L-300199) TaxID=1263415 RepID=U1GW45_ENDPU|nr:uncharacterized protein EPUS_02227 [Endocarpon pusillum Z07020]ERF76688.1 hypothetical protein EPUS_02227 [Endocarpon pusillum Z07020]
MASASPTFQAKKALRKHIKDQISGISPTEIGRQSKEVTDQVLKLPEFGHATRISVYLSMPKAELCTANIVREALSQGKRVFVPYIQKLSESTKSRSYMEMFALHSQEDLDSLQPDAWGIPTLGRASLQRRENALGGLGPIEGNDGENKDIFEGLDMVLLPGVAFDHSGGRLGHGKGFYDQFLQSYWEAASRNNINAKMPRLIGLALKQQLLPPDTTVPTSTDDWRVDQIITGS